MGYKEYQNFTVADWKRSLLSDKSKLELLGLTDKVVHFGFQNGHWTELSSPDFLSLHTSVQILPSRPKELLLTAAMRGPASFPAQLAAAMQSLPANSTIRETWRIIKLTIYATTVFQSHSESWWEDLSRGLVCFLWTLTPAQNWFHPDRGEAPIHYSDATPSGLFFEEKDPAVG